MSTLVVASTVLLFAAPVGAAPAPTNGSARPRTVPAPLTLNETWSTGALPDPNGPIALSSPVPVDLDGHPSVVVGDRTGNLYAYQLADPTGPGSPPVPTSLKGWPTFDESGPIDSTPSVATSGGQTAVLVGTGNDLDPTTGGYQAYNAAGHRLWFTEAKDPAPDVGVQAGITVGTLQSGNDAVAGSLGQVTYALNAGNGAPLTGWPFLNTDSTHSTAALADLYGTGHNEIIVGGDQTAGRGAGQEYANGGHLRILSAQGNQICRADTNQVVDSSPAVGGILNGGATGIVVGTGLEGDFQEGASDTDAVLAYNGQCQLQWSTKLDGSTFSSPALSDVLGNGSLQVVEGTDQGVGQSGSVWVLNGVTGQPIWKDLDIGRVIGSVVTADLTGQGYDDVIVPTVAGTVIRDGRTGAKVADLSPDVGLQNSPLVTDDPNGTIGITLAGYILEDQGQNKVLQGEIDHYEIPNSNGGEAVGNGSWPMFHHDPQLTGDAGRPPAPVRLRRARCRPPPMTVTTCLPPTAASSPSAASPSAGPPELYASTRRLWASPPPPPTGGYWEVASDGGIFAFGGARFYGSMGGNHLNKPIVGMAATPDGKGYWLVASDGGVFAFGDARFYGSMGGAHLNAAGGRHHRLHRRQRVPAGGLRRRHLRLRFRPFLGSMGGSHLNKPVVGMVNNTNTGGYWEVAADGGIFSFGGAPFYGSTGNITLNKPIVAMAETPNGSGYRLTASDGGVFSFRTPFFGSMGRVVSIYQSWP